MAEGTRMAAMRRVFLAQLAQTSPQPLNVTLGPGVIQPRIEERSSGLQRVEMAEGSMTKHMGKEIDPLNKVVVTGAVPSASEEAPRLERQTKQKGDSRAISDPTGDGGQKQKQQCVELKKHYLPLLKRLEKDRKEALAKVKFLSEQNQKLAEENKKLSNTATSLVEDLKKAKEENDRMLKDLQSARTSLENALKELEEAKKGKIDLEAKINAFDVTESKLEELREKYNDVLLNLSKDVYSSRSYPSCAQIDDHHEAKHSGTDQQPRLQDEKVESKDRAINLD
ncbi:hypothetical protein SESBI_31713 [Sesbania bispinosa]|nr:hypothetical protein SESBI_31713 [Sesbania bispinosa]